MQDNIKINIESDLDTLLKQDKFSSFYLGLYDFLKNIFKNKYYAEFIEKLKGEKKSWNVTITSNHKKTDKDFGSKLSEVEYKKLCRIQRSGDINKLWNVMDLLKSFVLVADKPIQTLTKKTSQKAWDFNQRKWDYLEVIKEKNKINNDINEFERDIDKYKLAIKKLGKNFIEFLEEKENVVTFIGASYDQRTCKLNFGKKNMTISNDDQRIKFFYILANSNKSVGFEEICRACLPTKTYQLCLDNGCENDIDFSDKAKDIKRNFVDLLLSLGCKKGNIDKNLISNKNSGYLFVRK